MIERILLVVGHPNAGKSYQLRHMFSDPRLGGKPLKGTPKAYYEVAPGRYATVRIMSSHESKDTLDKFLFKIKADTARFPNARWLVGRALHVNPNRYMPALDHIVTAVENELSPGRIKIVVLSPDYQGGSVGSEFSELARTLEESISSCEVHYINARQDQGLCLARLLLD